MSAPRTGPEDTAGPVRGPGTAAAVQEAKSTPSGEDEE